MKLHEKHKKVYDQEAWGAEEVRKDEKRAKAISLNRLQKGKKLHTGGKARPKVKGS